MRTEWKIWISEIRARPNIITRKASFRRRPESLRWLKNYLDLDGRLRDELSERVLLKGEKITLKLAICFFHVME